MRQSRAIYALVLAAGSRFGGVSWLASHINLNITGRTAMLKRRIRALAVTGAAIAAAGIVTLSTTAASAAPKAPAAASKAALTPSGCVTHTFDIFDGYTRMQCVVDMQVLLNNLWNSHVPGPNQELAADGLFGVNTQNDVVDFNLKWTQVPGQYAEMTPVGWQEYLCILNWQERFTGFYWQNAGCNTIPL